MSFRRRSLVEIDVANSKTDEEFVREYIEPSLPDWQTWTHPGTSARYALRLVGAPVLAPAALDACFALVEQTSAADYRASTRGWKPRAKRREMRESALRYVLVVEEEEEEGAGGPLVVAAGEATAGEATGESTVGDTMVGETTAMRMTAREAPGESTAGRTTSAEETARESAANGGALRGFLSMMPTYEGGEPVLYCYEIHLVEELRGTGLGTRLMDLLHNTATNLSPPVCKVMLTCFIANTSGLAFYRKQGFEVDPISPGPRALRGKVVEPDFAILSRRLGDKEGQGEA